MKVKVVRRAKVIYKVEAVSISLPTPKGWLGIFPGQTSTVEVLDKGKIIVDLGYTVEEVETSGGVVEVADGMVTIVTK